uniref:tRNA 2'-phosphotransferase 1 n=1 Tax=Diabrotica virgifera virgifera TaxID=50390 RepID=A0A6P7FKW0_DIAVI
HIFIFQVVDNSNLTPLNGDENIDVIHGTFYKNWESIKIEGISRANRNHIHFALGLPSDKSVISGVRQNCQVFIYINLKLATSDNLKFYRSANGVVLSPGNENGFILPKYFIKVLDRSLRNLI